jgi:predicted dehydrogenase
MGIGIHTGNLILGIFGDEKRHNAGVISDVVNTASRLEGLTKIFGVSVLVSEDTILGISKAYRYNYRYLGRVQVKGRKGIMNVYEFFDGDEDETAQLKSETAAMFRQGLEEYFEQQFAEAALHFKKVFNINPKDRVAEHYLHRAAHFLINPVPPGWAGVEHMEDK